MDASEPGLETLTETRATRRLKLASVWLLKFQAKGREEE